MSDSGTANAGDVDSTETFETMVIRAWMEPGREDGFRARLTVASGSGASGATQTTSVPTDVIDAVSDWLAKIQSKGSEAVSPDEPRA